MSDSDLLPLTTYIRDIPDFPRPGILFKDITPLLADGPALRRTVAALADEVHRAFPGAALPELIVGIESRGFIFGAALALQLGIGFIPVRKPGKLPYRTVRGEYELEYGNGVLEIHEDLERHKRVLVVDDLLATGGTAGCAAQLCENLGATVLGYAFVIELDFLGGRQRLGDRPVLSLLHYK